MALGDYTKEVWAESTDITVARLQNIEDKVDELDTICAPLTVGLHNVADASYAFVLDDAGKQVVAALNGSPQTFTVPANASVAFPVGTQIFINRGGTGEVAIAAASSVTIYSEGSKLRINLQYQEVKLFKVSTNGWILSGNLKT